MQECEDIIVARSSATESGCCDKEASVVIGGCVLVCGVGSESSQVEATSVVGALVNINGVMRVLPASVVITDAIVRRFACVSVAHT